VPFAVALRLTAARLSLLGTPVKRWSARASTRDPFRLVAAPFSGDGRLGSNAVPGRRRSGSTLRMKTAISLPDAVFHAAERQAKRAQKLRSQLYADALVEHLARHAPDEVTEAMNQVVDHLSEAPDQFVHAAAQSVLSRVEC